MGDNNGSEYLLDLNTAEVLPTIRIDGEAYPLRMDAEYAELLRLRDFGKRVQTLTRAEERTEQEETELRDLVRKQVRSVLKAPDEVLGKLSDIQRVRIVMAFNDQLEGRLGPTKAPSMISHGSGDSTAAQ
jgi:hypothetical protein